MNQKELGEKIGSAKKASASLLHLNAKQRKAVLVSLAKSVDQNIKRLISANSKDAKKARKEHKSPSFIERLSFDVKKIKSLCDSIREIANAKDFLFETLEEKNRPSGLRIRKVRFPLGLLSVIFESRPNVTLDAFVLSFKSGNAVIFKGGKEIIETNNILVKIIRNVLRKHKINANIIQDVSGMDRKFTLNLIQDSRIDCLIPRGGKNLIEFVKKNATVPIIETGASVVHSYVDASAELDLAAKVVLNAKLRRVSICNALDVLIVHKKTAKKLIEKIANELSLKNVELLADQKSYNILKKIAYPGLKRAANHDFDTEFLDYILAVKIVGGFEEALEHIKRHSLGHSEAIITRDNKQVEKFFREIDAACLYLNTSTQFSDGGEFGMGGEIGISTQKLHTRGPFSYRELTTYKYLVESGGATRK